MLCCFSLPKASSVCCQWHREGADYDSIPESLTGTAFSPTWLQLTSLCPVLASPYLWPLICLWGTSVLFSPFSRAIIIVQSSNLQFPLSSPLKDSPEPHPGYQNISGGREQGARDACMHCAGQQLIQGQLPGELSFCYFLPFPSSWIRS